MDPHSYMKELLIDKLINETMFKYVFNRNIISFNYVILNKQLGYFLKERYNENRIELSAKKSNVDGLSGLKYQDLYIVIYTDKLLNCWEPLKGQSAA